MSASVRLSESPPRRRAGVLAWAQKGVWSVLDQGLFAGANFVVNVLLARWLSPGAYGAYTVAFTVFLLYSTVHQGFLTEPMLVFGPGRFRQRLPAYLRELLHGHVVITAAGFALLAAGALVAWATGSPPALVFGLLGVGAAQIGILLTWLTRSSAYVTFEPKRSAEAGGVYALLLLGGMAALAAGGLLGPSESGDVLLAMAVTGVAGLVSGFWLLRRSDLWPLPPRDPALGAEARDAHLTYGRWAVASGGVDWVAGYLPLMWLSVAGGLAEAGGLRALYNFALPAIHVFQVLGTLMVPTFVAALARGHGRRTLGMLLALALALAGAFGAVLVVAGGPLMHLIYDGKFDAYADQLWLVALLPVGIGLVVVLLSCLRALERPRLLFQARCVALALTLVPAALLGGVTTARGALLMIVAISGVSAVLLLVGAEIILRRRASGEGPDDRPGDESGSARGAGLARGERPARPESTGDGRSGPPEALRVTSSDGPTWT